MPAQPKPLLLGLLIAGVVVLAIVTGAIAILWTDPSGQRGSGLSEDFDYDLQAYQAIDPALVRYQQVGQIPIDLQPPRAVAVGPEDRIYVAGQNTIRAFSADGARHSQIDLQGEPYCLAVGRAEHRFPGRIYVGMKDHVEIYNADGTRQSAWDCPSPKTILTSIALAEEDVFAADAWGRVVYRYDTSGKLLGQIGRKDESRNIRGFIIPSPYFDVAIGRDGLLRVVNPGAHLIEAYTFEGDLEFSWGMRGIDVKSFCGCCNPSHLAILPDGRFVTAEKGIFRVKVYGESGDFECVVAGPDVLAPTATAAEETREDHRLKPTDVTADSQGRVILLDPNAGCVRIFQTKQQVSDYGSSER